jgi:uroporphyrinogen III methyltransferase/synthase
MSDAAPAIGKVYLVGAGPGDPELLTLKGRRVLATADVIVYDRLANPKLLRHARPEAERVDVGKRAAAYSMPQTEISDLLVERARAGRMVCRLKGGDPFVFGRGGEEAEALVAAGVPFEVVPGVTSAIAVPAYAGIPVTHRGLCASFGIVTGHETPDGVVPGTRCPVPGGMAPSARCPVPGSTTAGPGFTEPGTGHRAPGTMSPGTASGASPPLRWAEITRGLDTVVFLMGVKNLPTVVGQLLAHGRAPETPIALIRWGTHPGQETLVGTLATILEQAAERPFSPPAVIVVGEVVRLRERLRWFDNRPLFGRRVLVTRARDQASELVERLEEAGAEAVEFPLIRFEALPPPEPRVWDEVYDWVIFTSGNAVRSLWEGLWASGRDVRALGAARIAAVGAETAAALAGHGLRADFVPEATESAGAAALLAQFPSDVQGRNILLPRAEEAPDLLPDGLRQRGATVRVLPVYRTVPDGSGAEAVREQLAAGEIDAVTFTASSTARIFRRFLPEVSLEGITVACIGPTTAATARELGLPVTVVAEEQSIQALVGVLATHFGSADNPS